MSRAAIFFEIASVFLGVCLVTWLVGHASGPLGSVAHLALAAIFLMITLRMVRQRPHGARTYGIALGGLLDPPDDEDVGSFAELLRTLKRGLPDALTELAWALAIACVLFPAYGYAYAVWHEAPGPFELELPPHVWDFTLGQLVIVALPEEALFRGYFQTRLSELWPPRGQRLGAPLSLPAWLMQSALFGGVHLMGGGGAGRLSTFFPGLLFGWLRARRGGIGAAVFLHTLSNLFADVLARSLW